MALFFFFNDTATTEIYTLSLHDALPIYPAAGGAGRQDRLAGGQAGGGRRDPVPQPAVQHRPAADRRRDHPADDAVGRAGALHPVAPPRRADRRVDRKSTRLNSSHANLSYAV